MTRRCCEGKLCPGNEADGSPREAEFVLVDPLHREVVLYCRSCAMWAFERVLTTVKQRGEGRCHVLVCPFDRNIQDAVDLADRIVDELLPAKEPSDAADA